MGYFVVMFVVANYIEDSQENMLSSSAIERWCVCVCVCVSNRQDVGQNVLEVFRRDVTNSNRTVK